MKAIVYSVNPLGWGTCKWLKFFWPGCLLSRLNGLVLREIDPPALPGDDWVLCRTVLGGICGSDVAVIAQRQPPNSFLQSFTTLPMVFGHENVAVVERAGSGVDASWVGKRVCVEPTLCCRVRGIAPACKPCQAGQFGACENFSADGDGSSKLPPGTSLGYCGPVGGSWGEYFVAHVSQLIDIPQQIPDALAILTDPLACSLHATLRADLSKVERVLVYGAGILGLGVVWALRATGYAGKIDIIARHRHQGRLAETLGADEAIFLPSGKRERFQSVAQRTGARLTRARFGNYMLSGGYDAVFECVGSESTIEEALKWTAARGQVILVGTGHGRGTDMTAMWFRELTVIGVSGRGVEDFAGRRKQTYQLVHEFMLAGGADVSSLLTHTFPQADFTEALSVAMHKARHESVKVAFRF